jgi:hypothetical protein
MVNTVHVSTIKKDTNSCCGGSIKIFNYTYTKKLRCELSGVTDELGGNFFFLLVMIYNKKNLSPVSTDRNQPWPPGKHLKAPRRQWKVTRIFFAKNLLLVVTFLIRTDSWANSAIQGMFVQKPD